MNKIFKYSLMFLAAGFAFASCSDKYEYTPAPAPSGAQVYFSNEMSDIIELSKSESSFKVTVLRAATEGEISVPVKATMPEGSIFNVPATVSFADGENASDIVVTYNPDELNYGDYTDITLQIGDETYTTPYGVSTYSFSAGATAWVSMGKGYYREDLFTSWYAVDNLIYEVEIEKNVVEEGMYRVVNPYGEGFPYNDPGDWDDTQNYYMVIDATDPDYVWIPAFNTGCDWGKGEFNFLSFVQYYLNKGKTLDAIKSSNPELFGTLKDGVITMPEPNSMLAARGEDGYYYSNPNGMFAVALPGSRIADYSLAYEYKGRFIDTNKQYYVEGVATFGDDVATAQAALVTEDTYESVYDAIVAGTYENAVPVVDGEAFRLPFDETGIYYVLIVAYNADGEVAGELTSKVKAEIENGGEPSVTWEAAYVGNYYYDLFSDPDKEEYEIDEGLTLSVDADNDAHYQIAPWGNEKTLEFIWNEDGSITVPADQPTGVSGAKGELFVTDVQTFTDGNEKYAAYVSGYEGGKFTFYLVYYNDGEAYIAEDTFTLTGTAGVKKNITISTKQASDIKKARAIRLTKLNLKRFAAK